MSDVQVEVEIDPQMLRGKLATILDDTTKLAINNTLARYCHPYVPYLHGPLSETVEVTADGVRYTQPYARRQYYGTDFNFTKDYHPLATAMWDKAMMRDRGEDFVEEVQRVIAWRAKQIYG